MKKSYKLFAFAILASIALSTTSCSKCQTCNLVYSDGQVSGSTEFCDDKDAMDQAKDDCESLADQSSTLDCNCSISLSF